MRRRDFLFGIGAIAVAPRVPAQQPALWTELQAGGLAILLRHAQTEPGLGDPPGYRLSDCSTQRNLSDEGRRQAARIGAALAAGRASVEQVLSSQWCRCLDTARLAFPGVQVEPFPALNSFFDDRSAEPAQTRQVQARIATITAPANIVLVTHHVNILALTGVAAGAGEAVLVRPAASGPRVVGRLAL
jgi:phosphohistidine phosphatase SixA